MRETKAAKAARYLLEGRVVLVRVTEHLVVAFVRGDGALYRTQFTGGRWECNCPHRATTTDCCHVTAVKRVVAVDIDNKENP